LETTLNTGGILAINKADLDDGRWESEKSRRGSGKTKAAMGTIVEG
jgi:hypothetical protein